MSPADQKIFEKVGIVYMDISVLHGRIFDMDLLVKGYMALGKKVVA